MRELGRAVAALGTGLLAHPANRALRRRLLSGSLDVEGYHHQVVNQAFRMLLSTGARADGTGGASGGRLASPDLDGAHLGDAHRDEARAALAPGSPLAPRELGNLYEGIASLEPHLDVPARRFALRAAPDRRRATGRFYTPGPVVEHLVALVVDPLLDEAERVADVEGALLGLTVLDPACGSGHFLVAAADRLAGRLAQLRADGTTPSPAQHERALVEVTVRCLYGIDVDAVAVELARASLWLAATGSGAEPDGALDRHVVCGHALVGASRAQVAGGIPDAAFEPVGDDHRALARRLRRANAVERSTPVPARATTTDQLARQRADAWCAAFLQPKRGEGPFLTTGTLRSGRRLLGRRRQLADALAGTTPLHLDLAFPEVGAGFAAVVGNPPFFGRLKGATALAPRTANLLQHLAGEPAKAYADAAALFLLLGARHLRPGGRIGLVQPLSVLTARDATAVRRHLAATTTLEALWVARRAVFGASVATCALVLAQGRTASTAVRRFEGGDFRELAPRQVDPEELGGWRTWAPLASDTAGVPDVELPPGGTLADLCTATADFRDQYYGLAPHVREAGAARQGPGWAPLVTAGAVDPLRCWWGERTIRFNKVDYQAPVVDLGSLEAATDLGPWARARLVPKLVLATQTRVLEVIVDEHGTYLPSVPLVTITAAGPDERWLVAAVLLSPPATAWAARHHLGAGLSARAIKLSAREVLDLPTPGDRERWERATGSYRAAAEAGRAGDEARWRACLVEGASLMCEAYGQPDGALLAWWCDQLPGWRRASPRLLSRRGS